MTLIFLIKLFCKNKLIIANPLHFCEMLFINLLVYRFQREKFSMELFFCNVVPSKSMLVQIFNISQVEINIIVHSFVSIFKSLSLICRNILICLIVLKCLNCEILLLSISSGLG